MDAAVSASIREWLGNLPEFFSFMWTTRKSARSKMKQLAGSAPSTCRVICLRSAGSLDASGLQEVFTLHAKNAGMSYEEFVQNAVKDIPLRKLPALKEIADVAAFMASERASAVTGTAVNISCGQTPD